MASAPPRHRRRESTAFASLEGRVRSGAIWSGLSTLVMKFGNIAITAVVVRLVTPADFGVFAAAITISAILSSAADWGVSACLVRGDMDPDEIGPTVALVALTSCSALALGMTIFAPALASVFAAPNAVGPIRVISLCLVIAGFVAVPSALLRREFRQDRIFLSNLIAFVPTNGALIILALHGFGAMAFAWSRVIGAVCEGTMVILMARKSYWPAMNLVRLRQVLRFGLPLAGANLVNYTLLNADYALVGHQLGTALLGTYLLAFNVASWPTSVLSATVNGVAMPAFSRVQSEAARLAAAVRRSSRAVCLIAVPIGTLSCTLANPLITTVYGSTWHHAIPVLAILSVYGTIFILVSLLSNLLVGTGQTTRVLLIQLAWISTLVPAMALGVRVGGLSGVACAHVLVLLVVVVPLYLRAVARQVPGVVGLIVSAALPPALASIVAGAAALLVSHAFGTPAVQLILGGLAGGAVYVACAAPMLPDYLPTARLGPVAAALSSLPSIWPARWEVTSAGARGVTAAEGE